jgi:hypothetical protein
LSYDKTAAGGSEVLRENRRQQLEQRLALGLGKLPDDALVFPGPNGAPQSPRDLSTDWAVEADRLGLEAVTFHALRDTHVWLPKTSSSQMVTPELANRVIIHEQAGAARTAGSLAVVAGEVAF